MTRLRGFRDAAATLLTNLRGFRRCRGRALVLAYHNVVPDACPADGDTSLHLPFSRFAEQLDALQEHFDIVDLEAAFVPTDPAAPPKVVLTFDDAYAGAVALAIPELRRRGLPTTIFVAPGLLGSAGTWWDALASAWLSGRHPDLRDRCLATGAKDDDVRALVAREGVAWQPVRPEHAIATSEALQGARYAGLTLGAHTWHHVNLSRWVPEWRERELVAPMQWLREAFPSEARPWLALPFGCGGAAAIEGARAAGYERCFRVDGGWRGPSTAALDEPRLNVPAGATGPKLLFRMATAPAD